MHFETTPFTTKPTADETPSGNSLVSLLYVSRSELPGLGGSWHVREIVDQAVVQNAKFGITGALIFTELHFSQILEGPAWSVKSLMKCIARDPRHRDVRIVREHPISKRVFDCWSMAYDEPAPYLDRQVKQLLSRFETRFVQKALSDRLVAEMRRHYTASVATSDGLKTSLSRGGANFRRGANLWDMP